MGCISEGGRLMAQPEKEYVSPEEYFEMEKNAENKNEYFNGEIFAMTGASFNHNLIAVNTSSKTTPANGFWMNTNLNRTRSSLNP